MVEGDSDADLWKALTRHAGLTDVVTVKSLNGTSGITPLTIQAQLLELGRTNPSFCVGVVVDADTDTPARCFNRYRNKFRTANSGLPLPKANGGVSKLRATTIAGMSTPCTVRTGVLALPTDSPGEHEKLVWQYLSDEAPALTAALSDSFDEVLRVDLPREPSTVPQRVTASRQKREKILVHMAGAVGVFAGRTPLKATVRLSDTYGSSFWDWTHQAFEPLITFLQEMVAP